jgi:hypothetical protein
LLLQIVVVDMIIFSYDPEGLVVVQTFSFPAYWLNRIVRKMVPW